MASVTLNDMAQLVGRTGFYEARTGNGRQARELYFACEVLDVRTRYGALDLLIRPAAGGGQTWVTENQVFWELPENLLGVPQEEVL